MPFRKIIRYIHLWLGLASGVLIIFLGLTGCILAFEVEIRNITEPFRKVTPTQQAYISPVVLKPVAEKYLQSHKALGIEYPGKNKAAVASYYDAENFEQVFMNPYTGAFLKHKNMKKDFFRIIIAGHYNLWLPISIGRPIVASATLVFLCMMISGIILWWPRNRGAKKQRFRIKWNTRWRRKNYDLHNVLGFYITWVAIFLALSGLIMGFTWFSKSVYWITSGGNAMQEHKNPESVIRSASLKNKTEDLWQMHLQGISEDESIAVYFAQTPTDPIEIIINHRPGTYYNTDFLHYDQYSGKLLPAGGSYEGSFKQASVADKIQRMNYDVHVGAIGGLPGKLLAFLASLIACSLPVTGFLIWRGRNNK